MSIRFSVQDIDRFAIWSGDRNPLHVDEGFARQTHVGQTVVHGALSAWATLGSATPPLTAGSIVELDLEFRTAVVPGRDYHTRDRREGDEAVLTLK